MAEEQASVNTYVAQAQNRSERERLADVKHVTGVFTGAYATHPFTGQPLPVWVADYVVVGYGTGAVMGVPAHDNRDYTFARHFGLPIIQVIGGGDITEAAYEAKEGCLIHSDFLNGLSIQDAIEKVLQKLEVTQLGKRKTTFRLRNAIFSRQRYWGEPFPIYYKEGMPYALPEDALPLELPAIKAYQPTPSGNPPLGRAENWHSAGYPLELNTMPGWAGSSWYFLRYMDPHNNQALVDPALQAYWQVADLYIGGAEHTTGHLLYARFWMKFLYDLGHVNAAEPFQKLINQGMIQGRSSFVYCVRGTKQFVSYNLRKQHDTVAMHVSIDLVKKDVLDLEAFKQWRPELKDATFVLENGQYVCGSEVEKMSKSKYNVVNPDTIIEQYGADTLRLHTMFLGPLEHSKPWDIQGIDGVFRFLIKLWRLFHNQQGEVVISDELPPSAALKIIHKTIKKIQEAIQRYAFNTAVSAFMICVNELTALQCNHRVILQDLVLLLAPFAPHIAEELWQLLGHTESVTHAPFPTYEAKYIQEDTFEYPIAINGKMRAKMTFTLDTPHETIKKQVLANKSIQKWTQDQLPRKIILVPQKIVNIVI